ncbi:MAG TPA: hypothetical protein VK206_17755 [Anaerolineales bacterium]|nr:hypothetical protein [Anaerolineales bacterium]HLO30954.1 hypothetical protein [Anaerolineales bacterium]
MIDYLIHAYKRDTAPFRSLSALSETEALNLMESLYVEGSIFWERFKDPVQYLHIRRQVEEWLRSDFIAKGGKPQASYPIYMMLGRSKWVQTMLDPITLTTTRQIQIPLSIFSECELSFTYPDSMVSFMLNTERNPEYYLPEYHGKVFTLSEIHSIVEANGLPGWKWGTNLPSDLANYIEAQIWNHEPLLAYMHI